MTPRTIRTTTRGNLHGFILPEVSPGRGTRTPRVG
jgi:hypothetical protein